MSNHFLYTENLTQSEIRAVEINSARGFYTVILLMISCFNYLHYIISLAFTFLFTFVFVDSIPGDKSTNPEDEFTNPPTTKAGLIHNKNRIHKYFKSFRQFVNKHRNDSVSALPPKKWVAFKKSNEILLVKSSNPVNKLCFQKCHNLHMCTLKTKLFFRDDHHASLIKYPTYFRVG